MTDFSDLRHEYSQSHLDESEVDSDPLRQFSRWFQEVMSTAEPEPNAMTLATVDSTGQPSARIVLLRGLDERGFAFFTNYESRKGLELAGNPRAALLFFWAGLERQVRVEGEVERVEPEESDRYFATRPRGSRIGAWASPQSQVIASRAELDERTRAVERQFGDDSEVSRPPNWGGYRLVPSRIEFWQGGSSRLHDRLRYRRADGGRWIIERLAP